MSLRSTRYGAGDQWVDVTRILNTLLEHSGEVTVDNRLAGDPCPGTLKSCIVEHESGDKVEYQERETIRRLGIKTTHLIYHICPFSSGAEQWKWNIEQLKQYASWTNGKRVVSVVQGHGTDVLDDVLREFDDFRIDKLIVRVNTELWEMETFPHAIQEIASTNPDEAFFYCHAKGTSKPADSQQLKASRIWTSFMYRFLFGNSGRTLEAFGTAIPPWEVSNKTMECLRRTGISREHSGESGTTGFSRDPTGTISLGMPISSSSTPDDTSPRTKPRTSARSQGPPIGFTGRRGNGQRRRSKRPWSKCGDLSLGRSIGFSRRNLVISETRFPR